MFVSGFNRQPTCIQCGATLPDGRQEACLACLLALALQVDENSHASDLLRDPGQQIGPYTLLSEIGEGGCGVVYLAEQTSPVRRQVALKIVKPGMDTRSVIARFEAEKQALALMDHPNIAKVFDAGSTEQGRPYFVMELVKGCKITEYCDEKKLSTSDRLALFVDVCHAVQHAHHKGVIHRDIKPSNIIVTTDDSGKPVPKIIDFGIAKATGGQQLNNATCFTAFEQFIGTPSYMSPEQAGLGALDVDTRSDIYSLGILLYELLAGRPPYDRDELRGRAVDEVFRIMREEEPPRPSMRLTTLSENDRTRIAAQRATEPATLPKLLRRELDWIVMKAIEKDRIRRYDSAGHFAEDIQRFLKDEPVKARPPKFSYSAQKWVRRNRALTIGATMLVLIITVSLGVVAWMFIKKSNSEQSEYAAHRSRLEWYTTLTRTRANQQVLHDAILQAFSVKTNYDAELSFLDAGHGWSFAVSDKPNTALRNLDELYWEDTRFIWHVRYGDWPTHATVLRYFDRLLDYSYPGGEMLMLCPGPRREVAHAIWTAPTTSVYTVTTKFRKCSSYPATVWVLHRTREGKVADLLRRDINEANPASEYDATLQMRAGEQLDFCVGGFSNNELFGPGVSLAALITEYNLPTNIVAAVDKIAGGPLPAKYAGVLHHIRFEAEPLRFAPTWAPIRKRTGSSSVPQVINGGFEVPWIYDERWYISYEFEPRDAFWTFHGTAGIAHNDSAFIALPVHPPVPEGAQCAILEATTSATGSMEQVIPGFQANTVYELAFETSQRNMAPPETPEIGSFNVYLDDLLLKHVRPASTNWEQQVIPFSTSQGAHLLKFTTSRASHDVTALVDDVHISTRKTR